MKKYKEYKIYILILFTSYISLLCISKSNVNFFLVLYSFITYFTFQIVKKIKIYDSNHIFLIFILFIIIKILFIFKTPILSDDIYRYLWEGKIFLHGINPYLYPPNSIKLINFRDEIFNHINHKNLPAIYPPFMIFFNSIVVSISNSIKFYKFILFLFDILTFFIILLLLNEAKINIKYGLCYFINPLTVIEIEWSGHNDIIMIFFFLLALYFLIKNKLIKSTFFYSISILSKFIYLVFIKDFLKNFKSFIVFSIIVLISYSFFLSNQKIFYSLDIYLKTWEFNGSIFKILKFFIKNNEITRLILLFLFGIYWSIINFKIKNIYKKLFFLIIGFILFSPTVHPWYGLWILPFICFNFYIEIYTFLLFLPFSYYVLDKYFTLGVWQENNFITFIIYCPLILFLFRIKKTFFSNTFFVK